MSDKLSNKKCQIVRVTDEATGKERTFKYNVRRNSSEDVRCDEYCPYANLCEHICDPRNSTKKDSNFSEFCGTVEFDIDKELEDETQRVTYIPAEGSLEEAFKDEEDLLTQVVGKDPVIRVSKLINNFCCDFCDSYNEEHSNCTADNRSCILRKLFIK